MMVLFRGIFLLRLIHLRRQNKVYYLTNRYEKVEIRKIEKVRGLIFYIFPYLTQKSGKKDALEISTDPILI